jgi:hypothetical protein
MQNPHDLNSTGNSDIEDDVTTNRKTAQTIGQFVPSPPDAGVESTYRSLDRIGTEKDVTLMTVMPPSHTKGLDVITFETPSDDIDDNSHTNGSATAPAFAEEKLATMTSMSSMSSDKTNQPKPLLSLNDITVITDSASFNSNEKKSAHIQSTIHLFDPSAGAVGSGADVDASGDDPHWPARSPAA